MSVKSILTAAGLAIMIFVAGAVVVTPMVLPSRYMVAIDGCQVNLDASNPRKSPDVVVEQIEAGCKVSVSHPGGTSTAPLVDLLDFLK